MKIFKTIITFICLTLPISGCVNTSYVRLDNSQNYPPSQSVQILAEKPSVPFKVIAMLESKGAVGISITQLLEDIRSKAASLGADAIIPTKNTSYYSPYGIAFNPLLGGYQTIGGYEIPRLQAMAIKYE